MKNLAILLLALMTAMTGIAPAQAFPGVAATTLETRGEVVPVQYRHHDRRWDRRHHYRGHGRRDYYGHRRHHRSNGGAIVGGLVAGAIIGGAIASSQHRNNCAARYRSYRASDNTYQPSHGPRRVCR